MNHNHCDQINELISGYIDNELSQQQRQWVSVHLESCETCQTLFEDLLRQQSDIADLNYPQLEQEKLMQILNEPTANKIAIVGWISLLLGVLGLFIWHWLEMWGDSSVHTLFKVLVTLIEVGGLLLLISVFRQRVIAKKSDRYNDIHL